MFTSATSGKRSEIILKHITFKLSEKKDLCLDVMTQKNRVSPRVISCYIAGKIIYFYILFINNRLNQVSNRYYPI